MGRTLDPPFDPFADDMSALIATYILEDVGVTAYKVRHCRILESDTSQSWAKHRNMYVHQRQTCDLHDDGRLRFV